MRIYILHTEWFSELQPIQDLMGAWKTHLQTKLVGTASHSASGQLSCKEVIRIQILLIDLFQRRIGYLEAKWVEDGYPGMLWEAC